MEDNNGRAGTHGSGNVTYMDYNSTTPVDPRVIREMEPLFSTWYGNPSSEYHRYGRDAVARAERARAQVAELVGMGSPDVIFTSGATEANNLALRGMAEGAGRRIRILVGAAEHKSVLEAADGLAELGLATTGSVPVGSDGVTDCDALANALSGDKVDLVSIMGANSETGVVQPIGQIAEIVHAAGAIYHCDMTQGVGRIPFGASGLGVDMVSLSSHKLYGPKGCGALVASREVRKRLRATMRGGGQENDLRSGTLNVPGIVGFGKACEIASKDGLADAPRQQALRDALEERLTSRISGTSVNGADAPRLPNTSNVRFEGVSAMAMIANVPSLAISSGSACSASTVSPSHVLLAMGMGDEAADESLRFSIGRPTVEADIDAAIGQVVAAVERIRGMTENAMTVGEGHAH